MRIIRSGAQLFWLSHTCTRGHIATIVIILSDDVVLTKENGDGGDNCRSYMAVA